MKTLVIGASTNKERYAYKAIVSLIYKNYHVVAIGNKQAIVLNVKIETDKINFDAIDTVTLYINLNVQREYYTYILGLKPNRVIFNPGTENPEFYSLLSEKGIRYEVACTLVLLATNQY